MSRYERGYRGSYSRGGSERYDDRDRDRERRDDSRDCRTKRPRDDFFQSDRGGKFQKHEKGRGRGRGRGRGGGASKREEKPEFFNLPVTKPSTLKSKQGEVSKGDEKIKLCANYFKVATKNPMTMKMFRVQFDPEMSDRKLCKILMSTLNRELGSYVYDDRYSIYLLNKPEEESYITKLRDGSEYQIKFEYKRDIAFTEANFQQILNLVIREAQQQMNLELIGRHYFDPNEKINFHSAKLQIWPGFKTAIRQHEKDLLLCCDIAHKIIREETVLDILRATEQASANHAAYQVEAKRRLRGMTVISIFNNKTYRIDDIDFNMSPRSTFKMGDREVSFIQYFGERYRAHIRHHNQPLLVSNPKAKDIRGRGNKKIKLVPELCSPVGITDQMRNDYHQMTALAEKTRMTPAERVQRLFNFAERVNKDGLKPLKENQLEIEKQLVEFDGRKLPEQKIIFGVKENSSKPQVIDLRMANNTADWTPNLKDVVLSVPVDLKKWGFIYPASHAQKSEEFLKNFITAGRKLGMNISDPIKKFQLINEKSEEYVKKVGECVKDDDMFAMVIVPRSNNARMYQDIKITSMISGKLLPVQVITPKVLSKPGLSVATKVAIQVNCKLGGIPWALQMPINGLLSVGFSVTVDTQQRLQQYGAMVAAMKPGTVHGKFFSCVNRHTRGSNISEYFGVNILKAVDKYFKNYGCLPENIIIYRDGCGEGQIEHVVEQELKHVLEILQNRYGEHNQDPKVGFVIINKRINTRIFSKNRNNFENPPPGTVVDDVITLPERYDFYLISQSVTQGTVAPTSYNIIHDSLGLKPKDIQLISYKMCHLYYNWSGTTRVPSVVQYAQKLAYLFGQHLHIDQSTMFENENIKKQLYFL